MSSPSAQCASGGSDLFLRPSLSRDSDCCVAAYELLSELLGERVVIQQALFLRGRDYDTAVRHSDSGLWPLPVMGRSEVK